MGFRDGFTSKKSESKVIATELIKLDPAAQELEDALNLLEKSGYCLTHLQPRSGAFSCLTCECIYKEAVKVKLHKAIEVVKRSRISGN